MSRSYKKTPCSSDNSHFMKKKAARSFRSGKKSCNWECKSGGAYKKYFCSYDICDFKVCEHSELKMILRFGRWYEEDLFYPLESRYSDRKPNETKAQYIKRFMARRRAK